MFKRQGFNRPPSPTGSVATSLRGDMRRKKTQIVEDIQEEFQRLEIGIGGPHLEEKIPPGIIGEPINVVTNVYGIKMATMPVFRYDITISAHFRGGKDKKLEFTKRSKDDSVVVDRKNMCRIAFEEIIRKFPEVFGEDLKAVYYDLQSILYTLKRVELGPKNEQVFELDQEDCQNIKGLQRFKSIEMLVRKVRDGFELNLGDLSHLNNDTTNQNHSLQQFIELATSQYPLFTPDQHVIIGGGSSFLMRPENFGFNEEDGPNLSDSKYLAIGAHKSVRYVEGPKGRGYKHAGLIVATKKTPFHIANQSLFDKARAILGLNGVSPTGSIRANDIGRIHSQFKTLHVEVYYGIDIPVRDVRISGVKPTTAVDTELDVNGEKVTVREYYYRKYGIELKYPNAPLATALERGRTNFYPLELCYIKDCQRANLNQLNQREVANMIRACAVPPSTLKNQIERNVGALHLLDSPYLEAANMKIMAKPLVVNARVLPAPTINYGVGRVTVDPETGKWPMKDSFLVPATSQKWAIYMIQSGNSDADRRSRFTFENLVSFTKLFLESCRAAGMTIGPPANSKQIPNSAQDVDETIRICKEEGCDFVFFVTSEAINNLHSVIKSCEQCYMIVTQDLKMKNAFEIVTRGKQETIKNIVCKTNEKLGGLNYSIKVSEPRICSMINKGTLFIGLGISHPGAMGRYERARGAVPNVPSVIGYAANMKKDPFDFIGDFVYDEPRRDEKFSTVSTIVCNCLVRFQNSRGSTPTRLVIYRNGTSEGQFGMALQYEIPLIHHALNQMNVSDCKLTVLVSQKAHNIRLFAEPMSTRLETVLPNGHVRRENLNIKPGTVTDAQLTHPKHSEFYLNSHLAIKGTARTPRYSVLLDENKFSMDEIEGFTYALSFAHQIINSPTSLPSPAYIALLYAKRGRALFAESRRAGVKEQRNPDGSLDFQHTSNRLCYRNTTLSDQRVNA